MTLLTKSLVGLTREEFQEHLDIRSVNTHDAAAVAGWFSEDGVQRVVSMGIEAHGRDAIRDNMAALFAGFPDVHLEVHDAFSEADRMCVQLTMRGTHDGEYFGIPATGRRIEVPMCLVFTFDADGLAKEEVVYSDALGFMQQLGVSSG